MPIVQGCYSGPWAQKAGCAALKDASGQCLDLLKEQRARGSPVSFVPRLRLPLPVVP